MNQQLPKKNEHFAAWYDAIIKRAKLAQPSPIKGMFMFLPRAWAIWEQIENFLNQQFQKHSIWNVKFPTILPRSDFEAEKEHIAGFDPELFYVQNHGSTEQLVLRPTSETAFCHYFKSQVHSYQDLPIKINQWCSVFRVEKNTKAFLRTCEFYWQELHTIHVNKQEAYDMVQQEIMIYKKCLKELLNLSFLSGWKSVYERFGGAEDTYTLETLMPDGQMLQSCTAHYLGQNFSKPFGLEFTNQKNQKELVYQTSAGLSTRILGAMIMADRKSVV